MLFDLPDPDTLYAALLARNERFDGQIFVCVASTGVFCRLTCPARKPKRQNCTFYPTIGECVEAGYRPCKRCPPLQAAALADPTIPALLHALDIRPDRRWSENHLIRLGYDPSTARRSFRRQFGMTFLEMARRRRLREGFETLAVGGKVVTAQHEASFESASAFRAAFARVLGQSPSELQSDKLLRATWIPTSAELKKLQQASKEGIGIGSMPPSEQATAELAEYFPARCDRFSTPHAMSASPFTQRVWDVLREIPSGETRSYSEIARQIGRPTAVRAVARANCAN
jgi:AraC family transcriptional regulator of adaptative response/methylated-DNA-[protein]-cysteine methyltransferase